MTDQTTANQAPQAPDTFAQARAEAPEGRHPVLPNRANGAGGSEAAGHTSHAACPEKAGGMEDLAEQSLDEGLELSFPASDPINSTGGITRIDVSGAEIAASREKEAALEAARKEALGSQS